MVSVERTVERNDRLWVALALAAAAWLGVYVVNERAWEVVIGRMAGLDLESQLGHAVTFFFYDTVKIMLLVGGLIGFLFNLVA